MSFLELIPGIGWIRIGLRFVGGLLRPVWDWLTEDWRNGPLVLCAAMWAAHMLLIEPRLREDLAAAEASLAAEIEAHNGTIANYVMATREAEKRQATNVTRVEGEQKAITERIEDDYQTRIAALRARAAALAERLRTGTASVDSGAPGAAGLPGSGPASGGSGEAACGDGFSLERRLIASEQAEQLDALIDWVIAQSQVKTSPAPEPQREQAP